MNLPILLKNAIKQKEIFGNIGQWFTKLLLSRGEASKSVPQVHYIA